MTGLYGFYGMMKNFKKNMKNLHEIPPGVL